MASAAESLSERHRRQLMHYLFLTGLPHGKLVNLRPERVEHEFITTALPPERHANYYAHLSRFLEHANLCAIQWINITRPLVQFKTMKKRK